MWSGVKGLLLISLYVVAISCECDSKFRHVFFQSDYKYGETVPDRTRVIPVRGCYMKDRIQACVNETTKNFHPVLDPIDWKEFSTAYVKCLLNAIFPENVLKDSQNRRIIYHNGEPLPGSEDHVLRVTYFNAKTSDIENTTLDSDIVFLTKVEGTESGNKRHISHGVKTTIVDKSEWDNSFSYATRIEGSINIGIINFNGGFDLTGETNGEGGVNSSTIARNTKTDIWFNVPAGKVVRTLWTTQRKKGAKRINANILVTGWLWVNQADQIANNFPDHPYVRNQFLIPVGDMAYYFKDYFTRINSQSLYAKRIGSLSTIDVIHSIIRLDEYTPEEISKCTLQDIKKKVPFTNQERK